MNQKISTRIQKMFRIKKMFVNEINVSEFKIYLVSKLKKLHKFKKSSLI